MLWSLCCKDQRPSEVWLLTADRKHSTLTLISYILHLMDMHNNPWAEVNKAMRRQGADWCGNGLGVREFSCFWHTTWGDLVAIDPSMVMKVWVGEDQGERWEMRGERERDCRNHAYRGNMSHERHGAETQWNCQNTVWSHSSLQGKDILLFSCIIIPWTNSTTNITHYNW